MAESIVIVCPECKQRMKVPAQAEGKKARCANCKAVIVVKSGPGGASAAPAKPAAAAAPGVAGGSFEDDDGPALYSMAAVSDEEGEAPPPPPPPKPAPAARAKTHGDDEDENPYGITAALDIARCPHCAKEMESNDAIVCLNCGYNTQSRLHAQTRHVFERTFWDWSLWLGPGIACVLTIVGLGVFDWWFCFYLQESVWNGWDETLGTKSISQGVRLWIAVMTLWVMWKAARFAFRRLILNPVPPEIEKKQ